MPTTEEAPPKKKRKPERKGYAPPTIAPDDPRLWNQKELAEHLGVPVAYLRAMKYAGFRMPLGRATIGMAHDWLKANADHTDQDKG